MLSRRCVELLFTVRYCIDEFNNAVVSTNSTNQLRGRINVIFRHEFYFAIDDLKRIFVIGGLTLYLHLSASVMAPLYLFD